MTRIMAAMMLVLLPGWAYYRDGTYITDEDRKRMRKELKKVLNDR